MALVFARTRRLEGMTRNKVAKHCTLILKEDRHDFLLICVIRHVSCNLGKGISRKIGVVVTGEVPCFPPAPIEGLEILLVKVVAALGRGHEYRVPVVVQEHRSANLIPHRRVHHGVFLKEHEVRIIPTHGLGVPGCLRLDLAVPLQNALCLVLVNVPGLYVFVEVPLLILPELIGLFLSWRSIKDASSCNEAASRQYRNTSCFT